jgi:hypothetical protein
MHQHGSPSALPRAPRHGGHGTATRVDTGLRRGEAGRATSGMSGRWTRDSNEGRYWASSRGGSVCYVGDVGSVDTGQNRWRGQETRWRPGVAGQRPRKSPMSHRFAGATMGGLARGTALLSRGARCGWLRGALSVTSPAFVHFIDNFPTPTISWKNNLLVGVR